MSARGGRASEPSAPTPWLTHDVRRRSEQAHEAAAVMPQLLAIDEGTVAFRGTARVWQGVPRKPGRAGIEITSMISIYNTPRTSVDLHDALRDPQRRVQPEDVLR